jgi:hypothetical protein
MAVMSEKSDITEVPTVLFWLGFEDICETCHWILTEQRVEADGLTVIERIQNMLEASKESVNQELYGLFKNINPTILTMLENRTWKQS